MDPAGGSVTAGLGGGDRGDRDRPTAGLTGRLSCKGNMNNSKR